MTSPEQLTSTSAWEVMPLGHDAWRICDQARESHDPSRLVAYVDRIGTGTLDVLWLRSPCPARSRYEDLDELLTDLDAAIAADRVSRVARPKQIPRFPPAA